VAETHFSAPALGARYNSANEAESAAQKQLLARRDRIFRQRDFRESRLQKPRPRQAVGGAARKIMRTVFVPALVERGFRGPFPHFRRITKQRMDILTVQFNRHGGSFVLEIAQCDPSGVTTYWGKHIEP
jgi:hypothetical protein